MNVNADRIVDIVNATVRNAEFEAAEPGFFLLDPFCPKSKQKIKEWLLFSDVHGDLRYPVTEDGSLHLGSPYILKPDGSIDLICAFFVDGYPGPMKSMKQWKKWLGYSF